MDEKAADAGAVAAVVLTGAAAAAAEVRGASLMPAIVSVAAAVVGPRALEAEAESEGGVVVEEGVVMEEAAVIVLGLVLVLVVVVLGVLL